MSKQESGAPSALAWIAEREAQARKDVELLEKELRKAIDNKITNPPEQDGEDFDKLIGRARQQLADAEDRHLKLAKTLREFDKQVSPEKRDTSESITREEGSKVMAMAAIYFRTSGEDLITSLAQNIFEECKSPADIQIMIAPKIREIVCNSLGSAVRENHLPPWALKAVEEVL